MPIPRRELVPDSRYWIPIVGGILDSLSCIPDSKAQDSGFQKQKFPRFRNADSFTLADICVIDQA